MAHYGSIAFNDIQQKNIPEININIHIQHEVAPVQEPPIGQAEILDFENIAQQITESGV